MSANRPAKSRLSDRWWLQPILKNIALLGTNISHPLKEDILLSSQEGISQIGSFSQFSFREHLIHLAKLYNTIFHQPIYRFPWNKGSHFPYLNHHHLVGPGRGTAFCWRLSAKASKCPLPRARSIEWSAASKAASRQPQKQSENHSQVESNVDRSHSLATAAWGVPSHDTTRRPTPGHSRNFLYRKLNSVVRKSDGNQGINDQR